MELLTAAIGPDGTFRYVGDDDNGSVVDYSWASVAEWIDAWIAEQRADDEDLLMMVGFGPLRDLLNYSGNGPLVVNDVECVAADDAPFRTALRCVTLPVELPADLRARYESLGVDSG